MGWVLNRTMPEAQVKERPYTSSFQEWGVSKVIVLGRLNHSAPFSEARSGIPNIGIAGEQQDCNPIQYQFSHQTILTHKVALSSHIILDCSITTWKQRCEAIGRKAMS